MAEMGKQFAHTTVALELLPGQFENSSQLRALVSAFVDEAQACEDALWELHALRWLWIASGDALDKIGDILDEPRSSDDDDEYRDQLYLKIAINVSEGEPERIIDIALQLSGAPFVELREQYPATVAIYCHAATKVLSLERVAQVTAGGVRTVVTASESATPFVFGVDRDASGTGHGAELAYGAGWGESGAGNEAVGGAFNEIFAQE